MRCDVFLWVGGEGWGESVTCLRCRGQRVTMGAKWRRDKGGRDEVPVGGWGFR